MERIGAHKEELYRAQARSQGVVPLPGVAALLEGLHRAGFRQAVGSSAPRVNLDLILELTGLARYFQAITAAEQSNPESPRPSNPMRSSPSPRLKT